LFPVRDNIHVDDKGKGKDKFPCPWHERIQGARRFSATYS